LDPVHGHDQWRSVAGEGPLGLPLLRRERRTKWCEFGLHRYRHSVLQLCGPDTDTGTDGDPNTGTDGHTDSGTDGNANSGTNGNADSGTNGNTDTGSANGNTDTGATYGDSNTSSANSDTDTGSANSDTDTGSNGIADACTANADTNGYASWVLHRQWGQRAVPRHFIHFWSTRKYPDLHEEWILGSC